MAEKNVEKTLKWYDDDTGTIRFEEDKDPCVVSSKVKEALEKYPVKSGDKVKVGTSDEQNEDGYDVVIFVQKVKGSTETASVDTEEKEATFTGYSAKWDGAIVTQEEDGVWYGLKKGLKEKFEDMGIERGDKVKFSFLTTKTGKPKITKIKKVSSAEKPKEEAKQEESKPVSKSPTVNNSYQGDLRQKSIEAQSSMNSANNTVAQLFAGKFDATKKEDGELVKTLIKAIAKANFDVIQGLKK